MLSPLSQQDIRNIYWFDCGVLGTALQDIDNTATRVDFQDGQKTIYLVRIYTSNTEPVLDKDLQRWLCDNKLLLGRPGVRGRVAVKVNFYLIGKYQKNGLSTYIHNREEPVFRSWGADEIQLYAMETGRWVWTRPRFGYSIHESDFHSLQQKYKEWQRKNGVRTIEVAGKLSDFPMDFLLSTQVSTLNLYKTP